MYTLHILGVGDLEHILASLLFHNVNLKVNVLFTLLLLFVDLLFVHLLPHFTGQSAGQFTSHSLLTLIESFGSLLIVTLWSFDPVQVQCLKCTDM